MGKILNFEPPLAECLRRRTESNRCATRRIGRVHRRLPLAGSVQKFSLRLKIRCPPHYPMARGLSW